jgi:hypothetical protein
MRIAFAVFLLLIAHVTSYPSLREASADNDESDSNLELELRSILNHLKDEQDTDEQTTRTLSSDDNTDEDTDDDDAYYQMNKRQGGLNIVDKQSKCEIECIHGQRNPKTGKGKTIKDAAKACRNTCNASSKKRGGKPENKNKSPKRNKLNLREINDDDDSNSNSSEEQQNQRREFYDYLMEQLQRNNNE